MSFDPLARLAERRSRAEPALAYPAHLLGLDKAGEFQDPDVLLDPVQGQPRRRRELAQRRQGRGPGTREWRVAVGSESAKNVTSSVGDSAPIGALYRCCPTF